MTINGPAPILLGFFFNAAIDQEVEIHLRENSSLDKAIEQASKEKKNLARYNGEIPKNSDQLGIKTLGFSGGIDARS